MGAIPKRSWQKRIEVTEQKWLDSKEGILDQIIFKEEHKTFCFECGGDDAVIRCQSCQPATFLCSSCDEDVHKYQPFHDRQWFDGFYKPLSPKEHVINGKIATTGKNLEFD